MQIDVMKAGLFTTVQDRGRVGWMKYGVPRGGAMDDWSYRIANELVGNDPAAPALEVISLGPQLRFNYGCWISLCGGDISASADGVPIPSWRPVWIPEGSVLTMGAFREGAIAYLAIRGGIKSEPYMGSSSTYVRGKLPGLLGRSLQAGDQLETGDWAIESVPGAAVNHALGCKLYYPRWSVSPLSISKPQQVRAVPGREYAHFGEESGERFAHSVYQVTSRSDRMGYRLEGYTLSVMQPLEMRSESVLKGTVQVPPDGRPIVLMSDSQTTGGYPRIAQVISADLHLLSQVPPGGEVRFTFITHEEAEYALYKREQELRMLKRFIRMKGERDG
ncbi:biotin-dependent carboxyltransferase family protein [Marinicrinis lubricantis]|uniref:Biotin-dependent carboxyltransferase family protein n=1 Tax=Marinicrinis lubricantis TaxID=2086470 RepID=A0ABW1ILH8_9BACL